MSFGIFGCLPLSIQSLFLQIVCRIILNFLRSDVTFDQVPFPAPFQRMYRLTGIPAGLLICKLFILQILLANTERTYSFGELSASTEMLPFQRVRTETLPFQRT